MRHELSTAWLNARDLCPDEPDQIEAIGRRAAALGYGPDDIAGIALCGRAYERKTVQAYFGDPDAGDYFIISADQVGHYRRFLDDQ